MTTSTAAAPAVTCDTTSESLKEKLGPALGRIPSGVYILTVNSDGRREGIMATWVAQAGFNPPKVSLAVNKERPILKLMTAGTCITVNVLSNKNMDIFKKFAGPAAEGADRFEGLSLLESAEASGPVFSEAVSYLDCRVDTMVNAGDHIIVLAEVTNGAVLCEEQPMTHIRKNGYHY